MGAGELACRTELRRGLDIRIKLVGVDVVCSGGLCDPPSNISDFVVCQGAAFDLF